MATSPAILKNRAHPNNAEASHTGAGAQSSLPPPFLELSRQPIQVAGYPQTVATDHPELSNEQSQGIPERSPNFPNPPERPIVPEQPIGPAHPVILEKPIFLEQPIFQEQPNFPEQPALETPFVFPEQPGLEGQPTFPEQPTLEEPAPSEAPVADPVLKDDLGDFILKEQEIAPAPTQQPRLKSVFLLGRVNYFRSSNVFSGTDPVDDALIRTGLTLAVNPQIGPRTYLITGIDSNLVRYVEQTSANYDELRIRAGVLQQLSDRMFGEIGWTNQQLFAADTGLLPPYSGDRFFRENALRLELSRQDPLAKNLTLTTFYQLQVSFAEPSDRTRLINFLYASLSYNIQPQLEIGLDYEFGLTSFLRQDRTDQYHQLSTRLTYYLSKTTNISAFAGFSFGNSTVSTLDFDGAAFGINLSVNLPLF
ncbi:MAG: hypothetical protein KME16_21005 [Scytolyngbya sp. HA4215-MV1]|nr:hypothetical protein [Scytolyngbya sp. HA4215-MV1]